ncbi:hypothetical protein B5M09_005615 [Aphanomyces astaci]|uniref:N-acetylgalactosaminide beta-1,3-galactosyltransferase n=1 Tax=Aphanomyces astaci TaxID=112090 RepID=A0A3R7WJE7_APHAT|nr:hypothetical protein B5M09_005615 [Aphanomyces astaci]
MRRWLCLAAVALIAIHVNAHASMPKHNRRRDACTEDYQQSNVALNLIQVSSSDVVLPRILCFVNTISPNHATKAQAIKDTWGKRCDKLVFLSNVTDNTLGAVAIADVPSDHSHLWQKHKASMQYIWNLYRHDFDWFYKADDDAYVIMENLRAYLRSPEIVMQQDVVPLQLGHRFRLTDNLTEYYVRDKHLLEEYQQRWPHWFNMYHQGIGGIQWKENCCAPDSIAFHYVGPDYMRHIERQLYDCRKDEFKGAVDSVRGVYHFADDIVFS